ncbi:hypothetical protein LZ32DRAFT_639915 [Colletotrichum eremochloae]|nr:hypothetical protein LZ32DRAFT_639915 [Colletotrichum eremochloae]
MATSEPPSPRISIDEDDRRPYVTSYAQKPKFHVGDKVYLVLNGSREGPYLVASIGSVGKCTLSRENGEAVRNGEEIDAGYHAAAAPSQAFVPIVISTHPYCNQQSCNPSSIPQDPKSQPTCKNIVAAFEKVLSLGNHGDWVYVHYSGHGTAKKPCGEFSNTSTGDLALVLLNDEGNQEECLWGFELASLLKGLVDHGLVLTVVLDCCFSGAVYRYDKPEVRYIPFTACMDSQLSSARSITPADQQAGRDASMLANWLLNPDGYAILAACGPHQETIGVKFDGKGYGALSYYLLDTIKQAGLSRRHRDIHGRLLAKFQGSSQIRNQTPMLYGNKDQSFFGPTGSRLFAFNIPIIRWENGILELQAGLAHGFQHGDQFILSPLALADGPAELRQSSVVANITCTRGLTSDLEVSKDSVKSLFKDLTNTSEVDPPFTSVGVHMRYAGTTSITGCQIEMRHAETVELVIENEEDISVYVHIYDLGPFWQIKDILSGTCCINPRGRRVLKIQMTVPEQMRDQGYNSCKDIIKVMLTSRPTSFDMFELPKLGHPPRQRKAGRVGRGNDYRVQKWAAKSFPILVVHS